MSKRTHFKRLALAVVASLGFGLLSSGPSAQAAVFGETLTLSSATATSTVGDSATVTMTHIASSTTASSTTNIQNMESTTVRFSCAVTGSTVSTCPTMRFYQPAVADTANVEDKPGYAANEVYYGSSNTQWQDTLTSTSGTMRSVFFAKAYNFAAAGTYTWTFYTLDKNMALTTLTPITWTVTVSAVTSATGTGLSNLYVSTDALGYTAETNRLNFRASSDSAVVVDRGTAATPVAVATAFVVVKNDAGDTAVATATVAKNKSGATPVRDTLTVTVNGPGLITNHNLSTTRAKAATLNAYNGATLYSNGNSTLTGESLTVWSDGTAGVSTISISNSAGIVIGSFTVTFTGSPASADSAWLTDTVVPLTGQNDSVVAIIKDSAGTVLKAGGTIQSVYLYSSDTKIAGDIPTSFPNPKTTTHRCIVDSTTSRASCPITITDTGVVTLTLRDSWTVAASTWSSPALELTITGNTLASATVAFDKATYAPGEKAIITITGKDVAGRNLANKSITGFTQISSTFVLGDITGGQAGGGTYNRGHTNTTFQGLRDTGIETRVVTMPTVGGKVDYTLTYNTFGSTSATTSVTASATVVDPNATAIATTRCC